VTVPVSSSNPVQVSIVHQEKYSRGLAVLGCLFLYGRIIALIPILIVLYVLSIVAFIVAWIMQFVVLFTGAYPAGAHRFLTGVLRWYTRSQAWLFGLTDKYPTSMQP
jgi:VIT1/CCC1 family predicted Fe2+/Mn2+ transporter